MSTNPPVGRWFVGSGIRHSDTAGICVLHEDGDEITEETIAEVLPSSDGNKTRDKQAALLAAAPDMLAALETVAGDGPADLDDGETVDQWLARQNEDGLRDHIAFIRDAARAAIARAKGA